MNDPKLATLIAASTLCFGGSAIAADVESMS